MRARAKKKPVRRHAYQPGRQYKGGQWVVDDGNVWIANRVTRERPGQGQDWVLVGLRRVNGGLSARHP